MEMIIEQIYNELLNDYEDGVVHCGNNGPYNDPETKIRNLCNLIIATCLNNLIKKIENESSIKKMGKELLSLAENDSLYIIRNKKNKDLCNGVLGHAWVIEALLYLYIVSNDTIYIEKAKKIYDLHDFDENTGLWRCPKKFGNQIDMTINHQIWFAGVAAELYNITNKANILHDLQKFEKQFWKNTRIHSNGLFCHYVQNRYGVPKIKNILRNIFDSVNTYINRPSMRYKENGYHMFCLCGLARLKTLGIGNSIFNCNQFYKTLNYCNSNTYFFWLENDEHDKDISTLISKDRLLHVRCNLYGYPYNAPGFEVRYVKNIFGVINNKTVKHIEKRQLELTYNVQTHKLDENVVDIYDLSYKVYEYFLGVIDRKEEVN